MPRRISAEQAAKPTVLNAKARRAKERAAKRLEAFAASPELSASENPIHAFQSGDADRAYEAIETLSKNRLLARQVLADASKGIASRAYNLQHDREADAAAVRKVQAGFQMQADLLGAFMDGVVESGRELSQADNFVIQDLTGKASTAKDRKDYMKARRG